MRMVSTTYSISGMGSVYSDTGYVLEGGPRGSDRGVMLVTSVGEREEGGLGGR